MSWLDRVPTERQLDRKIRRQAEMREIVGSWFDRRCSNCRAKHSHYSCTRCNRDFCGRCSTLHAFVC